MSACGASALSARNTGLFICGLILVVCFSQLAPQVEAKKTLLNTGYERAATAALRTTVTTQRGLLSETTTINCTKVESGSSVHVVCDGEEFFEEEAKDAPGSAAFFRDLFLSIFFVLTAGTSHNSSIRELRCAWAPGAALSDFSVFARSDQSLLSLDALAPSFLSTLSPHRNRQRLTAPNRLLLLRFDVWTYSRLTRHGCQHS